jgi:NAD-dependent deacetylase
MSHEIETLQQWVDESRSIVFYSGPGVSHASGIPDFRKMEEDHLEKYKFPPEALLSRAFFERKPEQFFRFYKERIIAPLLTAEPNAAHHKLAELEAAGKLRTIITENMDDLHQEAGSKKVIELHGSVMRNDCPRCERRISTLDLYEHPSIPYCDVDMCGGIMSPDITLYGDGIDKDKMTNAIFYVLTANVLIIAGTSLVDYPAAGILHHYSGKKMVIINEKETPLDSRADLIIHAPIAEVMGKLIVPNEPS